MNLGIKVNPNCLDTTGTSTLTSARKFHYRELIKQEAVRSHPINQNNQNYIYGNFDTDRLRPSTMLAHLRHTSKGYEERKKERKMDGQPLTACWTDPTHPRVTSVATLGLAS